MSPVDLARRAQHEVTVCNACRYCEQFCPVFPAIEQRRTFAEVDLAYLANLCHNCGECLYACQYAPPHEFGINLPRTLSRLRTRSYEEYCWPRPLAFAFRRHGLWTACAVAALFALVIGAAVSAASPSAIWPSDASADFYAVMPHRVMVALFGAVSAFVIAAMAISGVRFWRDLPVQAAATPGAFWRAVSDAGTLRHLHGGSVDCVSGPDQRTPSRRMFHHCTVYGFVLCVASTSVAAIYHSAFGWEAPYPYSSLPVLLGTAGGLLLVVGPVGLATLRRRRDPMLGDPDSRGLDASFLALLGLASLTGLLVLALRHTPAMGLLLVVHLGSVLALFVTLPYGKFVHALYRMLALVRYHGDTRSAGSR
jgi:citrate/tricarballylate utilization protein